MGEANAACSAMTLANSGRDASPRRLKCPPDTVPGGRWRFLAVRTLKILEISMRLAGFKSPSSHSANARNVTSGLPPIA
jgi:hypothetical protein